MHISSESMLDRNLVDPMSFLTRNNFLSFFSVVVEGRISTFYSVILTKILKMAFILSWLFEFGAVCIFTRTSKITSSGRNKKINKKPP